MKQKGLYQKYKVIEIETGKEVNGCFVLRPENDNCAFWAVFEYASICKNKNPILSEQLFRWLDELDKDKPE